MLLIIKGLLLIILPRGFIFIKILLGVVIRCGIIISLIKLFKFLFVLFLLVSNALLMLFSLFNKWVV